MAISGVATTGVVVLLFIADALAFNTLPLPCPSAVFCHGELLHTVQMARLYRDSKTFVDKKLKYPPEQVLKDFEAFKSKAGELTKTDIQKFVDDNFDPEGSEFEEWLPKDWVEKPDFLSRVTDPSLKTWAYKIHSFWKVLGRKIKDDVKVHPELYSLIYLSHPFIVPGGRLREIYYWDSYWVIKGLLLSEMNITVKGMLGNFMEMVETIGYIPNGGRKYYERSQPPLLIPMFKLYMDATNDEEFLRASLPTLKKEFEFWMANRTVAMAKDGKEYKVARYNVELTGPRPESYREDYELAERLGTEREKHELYFNLKSGAESGWDFSSRWFRADSDTIKPNLAHSKTREIAPVDLNAFIYWNAKLLGEFCREVGETKDSAHYENLANEWKTMLNHLMWDEQMGSWFDLDLVDGQLRKEFYPSNIAPLWVQAHASPQQVQRFMNYFRKTTALQYASGVPTSLSNSGEQWDFPNGWPPLQHIIVEALERSGNAEAEELAFELADKWIQTNYHSFVQSQPNHMFEKYDVTVSGLPGGGGEYEVVVGFGWTNGVVLDFLSKYGDKIQATVMKPPSSGAASDVTASLALTGLAVVLSKIVGQ